MFFFSPHQLHPSKLRNNLNHWKHSLKPIQTVIQPWKPKGLWSDIFPAGICIYSGSQPDAVIDVSHHWNMQRSVIALVLQSRVLHNKTVIYINIVMLTSSTESSQHPSSKINFNTIETKHTSVSLFPVCKNLLNQNSTFIWMLNNKQIPLNKEMQYYQHYWYNPSCIYNIIYIIAFVLFLNSTNQILL